MFFSVKKEKNAFYFKKINFLMRFCTLKLGLTYFFRVNFQLFLSLFVVDLHSFFLRC